MVFSNWLDLREGEDSLPDARDFEYLACVLHQASQKELLRAAQRFMLENAGTVIPPFWTGRAHHMTVKLKPSTNDMDGLRGQFGRVFMIDVEAIAYDEKAMAAVARAGVRSASAVPHITMAHSPEVGAAYSNELLADRSKWRRFLEIGQMYTYLLGVKKDGSVWPSIPARLASSTAVVK